MSNLQNNVETPMMEPRRPTGKVIEKRIRKLKIGIYTSFILSLVAIAISIVLLTKMQKLQEEMAAIETELSKVPIEQLKKLNTQFHDIESKIKDFRDTIINHHVKSITGKNDSTLVKSLPPTPDDNSNVLIIYKDDPFDDMNNDVEDKEEEIGADNTGPVDSVDTVLEIDSGEADKVQDPHAHHHHGTHDMTEDSPDLPKTPDKKRLCENDNTDDSDLCDDVEGSGAVGIAGDDSDDDLQDEGSGNHEHPDCIQFPRPVCPTGHKICYTKNMTNKCPIPICCPDS